MAWYLVKQGDNFTFRMKSSRAISRVWCLYETDVSRTEMALETSVSYRHQTRLMAQEGFIKFSHSGSFRSYINFIFTVFVKYLKVAIFLKDLLPTCSIIICSNILLTKCSHTCFKSRFYGCGRIPTFRRSILPPLWKKMT
jgi:hypothetical protein